MPAILLDDDDAIAAVPCVERQGVVVHFNAPGILDLNLPKPAPVEGLRAVALENVVRDDGGAADLEGNAGQQIVLDAVAVEQHLLGADIGP